MAATYLSHRNTQEGPGLLGVSAGCHHKEGREWDLPYPRPPRVACAFTSAGREGPAARNRVRVYRPHYTAGPPRRFTTGCRPVVARGEHSQGGSDPSPANDTCVGLVARPVRWPSVFEASRWGVTGCSGLFFDLRRAVH